jgi:iron complex transport system ATP-binding protein
MIDIILKSENLKFSYTEKPLIEGVSLNIKRGKLTSLAGPNGAGKTTLLYLMAGILKPYSGSVEINAQNIHLMQKKDLAKIMAVIPAELSVPFLYTVQEIVEMGRYPHLGPFSSMSAKDIRITEEAMEKTGVLHLRKQPFNFLSSGERQRTVIARALAQQPSILLMDEPTVHLDLHYQVEIYKLLKEISKNETTAIFLISHDLNFASIYSEEIILFADGRLIKSGPPKEIITKELISGIYKTEISIVSHPSSRHPLIMPE